MNTTYEDDRPVGVIALHGSIVTVISVGIIISNIINLRVLNAISTGQIPWATRLFLQNLRYVLAQGVIYYCKSLLLL